MGARFPLIPGGVGVTPNGPKFFLYLSTSPGEYDLTYTIQTEAVQSPLQSL